LEDEMEIIRKTVKEARIAAARAHANIAIFPLWTTPPGERPYLILDEALHSESVRITEVSQQGRVPDLCVVNDSDRPVLLLDGEELRGAKQNRVLNLTILAPAGKTIVVPVSCVEQGRWAHRSDAFTSSEQVLYARMRSENAAFVTGFLRKTGEPRSDQSAVWASIEDKMGRLGTRSATSAMNDIYRASRAGIEKFVEALLPEPGQTGAVFALNGRVAGVEMFDHPDVFVRMFPKLVRSWALDAIESPPCEVPVPPTEAAHAFLEIVAEAEMQSFPATGQGIDVRLSAARVTGGGIVDGGRLVHLNAFSRGADTAPEAPRESWVVRASRRFRGR
jgi:hypothetical protein